VGLSRVPCRRRRRTGALRRRRARRPRGCRGGSRRAVRRPARDGELASAARPRPGRRQEHAQLSVLAACGAPQACTVIVTEVVETEVIARYRKQRAAVVEREEALIIGRRDAQRPARAKPESRCRAVAVRSREAQLPRDEAIGLLVPQRAFGRGDLDHRAASEIPVDAFLAPRPGYCAARRPPSGSPTPGPAAGRQSGEAFRRAAVLGRKKQVRGRRCCADGGLDLHERRSHCRSKVCPSARGARTYERTQSHAQLVATAARYGKQRPASSRSRTTVPPTLRCTSSPSFSMVVSRRCDVGIASSGAESREGSSGCMAAAGEKHPSDGVIGRLLSQAPTPSIAMHSCRPLPKRHQHVSSLGSAASGVVM